MLTVPEPIFSKWYGISSLESIARDSQITGLPAGSPVLAVAQKIFTGPGKYQLPNYKFILLTECLVVVQDPDDAVKNAIARTEGYVYSLADGEISVSGADGAPGNSGENGQAGRPGAPGRNGYGGGTGDDARSVYLFAQSILSLSFALRANGGAGGSGGIGGAGGPWNGPLTPASHGGRGGNGGAGGKGGNGGQAMLIFNAFKGGVKPTCSALAGVPGPGGEGNVGGRHPVIVGPDGEPIGPNPNPAAPSGLRGSSGAAGAAGVSEFAKPEQVTFWTTVRDRLPSCKTKLFSFFSNHIQEMPRPLWDDYIAAEKRILAFFDPGSPQLVAFPIPPC